MILQFLLSLNIIAISDLITHSLTSSFLIFSLHNLVPLYISSMVSRIVMSSGHVAEKSTELVLPDRIRLSDNTIQITETDRLALIRQGLVSKT